MHSWRDEQRSERHTESLFRRAFRPALLASANVIPRLDLPGPRHLGFFPSRPKKPRPSTVVTVRTYALVETVDLLPLLLDRYERPLVRYAMSIVGDLEQARDVVQETFIRFVHRAPATGEDREQGITTDPLEGEAPWLFTVCRNRALDVRRKQSRIIYMDQTMDRTSEEPDPADTLTSRETLGSLLRLLDELSENQREVIRLKFQNDLSYREIADVTQLSVTNVGFLLHTGLKKLRSLVEAAPRDEWPIRQTV